MLHTRNSSDFDLDPEAPPDPRYRAGTTHPLTGPVHIVGAEPGDVLKVRILDVEPGQWAFTDITRNGFLTDIIEGPLRVLWKLNPEYAVSAELPGVRIPNRSFPGIVTVLPGPEQHAEMIAREADLFDARGAVSPPDATHASPRDVCGRAAATGASVCVLFHRANTAATWISGRPGLRSICPARDGLRARRRRRALRPGRWRGLGHGARDGCHGDADDGADPRRSAPGSRPALRRTVHAARHSVPGVLRDDRCPDQGKKGGTARHGVSGGGESGGAEEPVEGHLPGRAECLTRDGPLHRRNQGLHGGTGRTSSHPLQWT